MTEKCGPVLLDLLKENKTLVHIVRASPCFAVSLSCCFPVHLCPVRGRALPYDVLTPGLLPGCDARSSLSLRSVCS